MLTKNNSCSEVIRGIQLAEVDAVDLKLLLKDKKLPLATKVKTVETMVFRITVQSRDYIIEQLTLYS